MYQTSTTAAPAPAVTALRERVNALVTAVEQGRILDAFRAHYAADVSMQENNGAPTVGFDVNLAREEGFVAYVAEVHENRAAEVLVDDAGDGDGRAAIHWLLEFTGTDGTRHRYDQIALQTWRDGKIVSERFVYDTGTPAAAAH